MRAPWTTSSNSPSESFFSAGIRSLFMRVFPCVIATGKTMTSCSQRSVWTSTVAGWAGCAMGCAVTSVQITLDRIPF